MGPSRTGIEGAAASAGSGSWIRRFVFRPIAAVFAAIAWSIGLVALIFLLGLVAAVPVLNLVALGILLDAEGRVARSGRILDGFPLVPLAPRLGSVLIGVWLWLLPISFLGSLASDARILHPGSPADAVLHRVLAVVKVLVIVHLALALASGGRFSRFFRPLKNLLEFVGRVRKGGYWAEAEHAVLAVIDQLSLKYHGWLGLRGFIGAGLWLVVPTLLFAMNERTEGPGVLLTLVGAVLLMRVLCWVPFLQGRFAAEGRFGAFSEPGAVKLAAARAPIAFLIAIVVTLALSLPLFLFKIVLPPRDALWLVTPLFIIGLYPGKLLAGWALHRAAQREAPAHFVFRWVARLLAVGAVAFYVFVLFFMQFIGEHGKGVLFEHHAFLLLIGS